MKQMTVTRKYCLFCARVTTQDVRNTHGYIYRICRECHRRQDGG